MTTDLQATAQHSSMIDGVTVRSRYDYVVYGAVRGRVSQHRVLWAARASMQADQHGCRAAGGYSDASVYCWDAATGWVEDVDGVD